MIIRANNNSDSEVVQDVASTADGTGGTRGVWTNISLLICILLTPPLLAATAAKWVINKFSPLHIWSQRKSADTASNQESYRVRDRKPSTLDQDYC